MDRKLRFFLLAFIAASLAALFVLVVVNQGERSGVEVTIVEEKGVEAKFENVRYSGSTEGRLEWELEADSASRGEGRVTDLESMRAVFYTRAGGSYTLTAPRGKYRESSGEIDALGGVTVVASEGYRLRTRNLKYTIESGKITSRDRVRITLEGMNVTGTGLLVDVGTGRMTLLEEIVAVIPEPAV